MSRPSPTPIKDKVIAAALDLFAARGVAAVSVKDIAARSGASEGALYRHWGSKEAMAQSLFKEGFASLASGMRQIMHEEERLRPRLVAIVTYFCRRFDEIRPLMAFMLLRHHEEMTKALRPSDDTPIRVLEDLVADAVAAGELPPILPSLGAALVLGLTVQPATFMIYGRRLDGSFSALAPALANGALAALKAAAATTNEQTDRITDDART